MKINNIDLRQLYISNLRQEIPQSRKECPSSKELLHLFRTKSSEKKKTKIIDHITNCYYCINEFEFILKALRYEKQMMATTEKLFLPKRENVSLKNLARRLLATQFSWNLPSLAALMIIGFCLFIAFYTIANKSKNPEYRAISQSQLSLISPNKTKISRSSLSFRWENAASSDYYILEIFDEELYQIWKSPKIHKNWIRLPDDANNRMEKNKLYFWMITAFFANGKVIESPLREFYLIE